MRAPDDQAELRAIVYRGKGFVHLAEDPTHRYVLQVVGRRVDLVRDRPWGSDPPHSRAVAIADASALDPNRLSELFDSCTGHSATMTTPLA